MNALPLQGQVVLIIGAGRWPGPALAEGLAAQGAQIAVNDLSPVVLDPLLEPVQTRGGTIRTYVADATRGMPLRAMLDEVLDDFDRIDILVNNPRVQPEAALLEMDEWDWQRTIEMNLNGPFLVTQLVARIMREQGQGTILNIAAGACSGLGVPGQAAYAASQAGLLAFSQTAAQELIAYNIRVHTLCPDRPMLEPSTGISPAQALVDLAVFLCGSPAARIPGQVFHVGCVPSNQKGE